MKNEILMLGIESSCDETAAAVVRARKDSGRVTILSNVVASQISVHRLYGGVVPEIAGRAHAEAIGRVVKDALDGAGTGPGDLDGVAVTARPGLIGALLVGVNFAKAFAYSNGLPLVPVNHTAAHIATAFLLEDHPEPPFLGLVVSGGHTSFYHVKTYTEYVEIGGTRDDAAGEAFDKVGRVLGLEYPAGAAMDRLAYEGDARLGGGYVSLPSPALPGERPEFSFSGLKSASLNAINSMRQKGIEPDAALFASEFCRAVSVGIASSVPKAAALTGCRSLVVSGGVAANGHLREELTKTCSSLGITVCFPPAKLCGDNGAMTAAQGAFELFAGNTADSTLNASAEW